MPEISLQKNLHVNLPENIDITFQVIPEYSDSEEVICGWLESELKYIITADDPPGGMVHENYWSGMLETLKGNSDNRILKIIASDEYESLFGERITCKIFQTTLDGDEHNHILHLIVGEHIAYWVITVFINITDIFKTNSEVKEILKGARIEYN